MLSNLRSVSIEGHITDSAGNVIRNSQVIIKQQTTSGSVIIDTVQSDDSGYFITSPMPNGIYDIYESGIKISRIIHDTNFSGIQCFQANRDNYNPAVIGSFSDYLAAYTLNLYKSFIQLEPANLNTAQFGNYFPLYEKDISNNPEEGTGIDNEVYKIATFFKLTSDSRITISRFDIEYFLPLTAISNTFKRIKWAGVPGIRFYKDSKLVLPLDYYSIVANNPKVISPVDSGFVPAEITNLIVYADGKGSILDTVSGPDSELTKLVEKLFVGDILKIRFKKSDLDPIFTYWYGIVTAIDYSDKKIIYLEHWKSSRFLSTDFETRTIDKIFAFDGMFSNIMDIGQEVNQLFTITENFNAQNQETELYNYINQ